MSGHTGMRLKLSDFLDSGGGLASTAKSRACPRCESLERELASLRRAQLDEANAQNSASRTAAKLNTEYWIELKRERDEHLTARVKSDTHATKAVLAQVEASVLANKAIARAEAAEKRLAACEKDAQRYRWWRDNNCGDNRGPDTANSDTLTTLLTVIDAVDPIRVDALIDAAIAINKECWRPVR
jgi:hypothetical protein